ncbi:MAG: indolepyruvate oxidoreductase subunit beta [Deltaproteobacteria bacterium]|nr:indolepyruvate oxidoreductase subunit beta [Candidatus Anaeroferrophillus wilburensis]MBN2889122.1 indolepyruvate oxidoreductase subunit beta [Deltaproteobacteria bacterium]
MKTTNILLAGVGGQGVLLASQILTSVAIAAGLDVKQSEVHGMSQRGGSVTSHVRFGERVYSPTIDDGKADVVLGFERLEALRNAHCVAPGGIIIYNTMRINPSTVASGVAEYPEGIEAGIEAYAKKVYAVDGLGLALQAGNARSANTVMVGAISRFLPLSEDLWAQQIRKILPAKLVDLNLKAFELGVQAVAN